MKKVRQLIATCLAITFLVMTLIPCGDACGNESHGIEYSVKSAQEHHQQHQDTCSPLCSCSCCSTQMNVVHFPGLVFLSHSITRDFSAFKQPFVYSHDAAIWQPPKIG